jgi:hypothetical protein
MAHIIITIIVGHHHMPPLLEAVSQRKDKDKVDHQVFSIPTEKYLDDGIIVWKKYFMITIVNCQYMDVDRTSYHPNIGIRLQLLLYRQRMALIVAIMDMVMYLLVQ